MKWVRDFETLSKRKKVMVGIVGTVIGTILILLSDLSLGISAETSIRNLMITIAASFAAAIVWALVARRKKVA